MSVMRINSMDDLRLAPYRSLKTTNDTRWAREFVVEGDKLVRRLLESDFTVMSVLLRESYLPAFSAILVSHFDVFVVPDPWIERIVGFNFHRGVLACA